MRRYALLCTFAASLAGCLDSGHPEPVRFLLHHGGPEENIPADPITVVCQVVRANTDWPLEEIARVFGEASAIWAHANVQIVPSPNYILPAGDPLIRTTLPRAVRCEFVGRNVVLLDQLGINTNEGVLISIRTDPKLRGIILAHELGHFFHLDHTHDDTPYGYRTIMQSPFPTTPLPLGWDVERFKALAPEQVDIARNGIFAQAHRLEFYVGSFPGTARPGFVRTHAETGRLQMLSRLPLPTPPYGLWAQDNLAFVAGGSAVYIVDISTPTSPRLLSTLANLDGPCHDVRSHANTLYLALETAPSNTSLAIYDIRDPSAPVKLGALQDPQVPGAHSLCVEGKYAYLSTDRSMILVDVQHPTEPLRVGQYSKAGVQDAVVIGRKAYVATSNDGFHILDVYDPANIKLLGRTSVPVSSGHIAWPDATGRFMFTTEDAAGVPLRSWDVANLSEIRQVGEYAAAPGETVRNVRVQAEYAFVVRGRGLGILDITDPAHLVEVAHYDTSRGSDPQGAWAVKPLGDRVLVTDTLGGLYVFRLAP